VIIDAVVTDTPIFIYISNVTNGSHVGSLVLNNIKLSNVTAAVGVLNGTTVLAGGTTTILAGGTTTIDSWVQGNVYSGTKSTGKLTQGMIQSAAKPQSLLNSDGSIFQRGHPQYETYSVDQFISVKDEGATGDGQTDDTDALNAIMTKLDVFGLCQFNSNSTLFTVLG
jgi:glucan 1,3-beta-glucosidase